MSNENQSYAGKIAFVTGAANGIGRATAIAFARAGASVAVVDLDDNGVAEVVEAIEAAGGSAVGISCDVSKSDDVRAALVRRSRDDGARA